MSIRKKRKKNKRTAAVKKAKENPVEIKKETRRDRETYSGLKRRFFSKVKQEFHDLDYIHLLDEKAQEFLSHFMNEWLGANTKEAKLHKTKKDKKKVNDANNARNRDIYANKRAAGAMIDYEKIRSQFDEIHGSDNYEDELIDYIDSKKAIKN